MVIIWNYQLQHVNIVTKHLTYSDLYDLTKTQSHQVFDVSVELLDIIQQKTQ